jgi:hypothetical protein
MAKSELAKSEPAKSELAKPSAGPGSLGKIAVVGLPLFAMLAAAGWFAARAWISVSGPPMPVTGYVAMTLGVVFSVVVGCGLMALLFYSSRHGYDDLDRTANDLETQDGESSEQPASAARYSSLGPDKTRSPDAKAPGGEAPGAKPPGES